MKKKSIIYLLLFIVLLFIFSVSIVLVFKGGKEDTIKEDDVYIEATSLNVTLKDILAVSDDFGKSITDDNGGSFAYIDIEIVNDVDQDRNYQLFVTESPSNKKELGPNYIKLFLSDLKDEALPNYDSNIIPSLTKLNYIKDKPNSRLILSGTIGPKKHINVKLRSWISESFVISEGNNSFSYDLGVRAVK